VNLISGLFPPDGGRILFRDQDVTRQSVHGRIRAGIARSFQLVNLFDQLSALDNVALTVFARQGKTLNLTALAAADSAVWDEAIEILKAFGLEPKARMLAGGVSQGERKLLDVAVAFALRPKLLFLDEPTSGVSTREKAPIMDTVTSVVRSTASRPPSSSTTWTWSSTTPTGSSRCTRGRFSPTGRRTRSGRNERVITTLIGTTEGDH